MQERQGSAKKLNISYLKRLAQAFAQLDQTGDRSYLYPKIYASTGGLTTFAKANASLDLRLAPALRCKTPRFTARSILL